MKIQNASGLFNLSLVCLNAKSAASCLPYIGISLLLAQLNNINLAKGLRESKRAQDPMLKRGKSNKNLLP